MPSEPQGDHVKLPTVLLNWYEGSTLWAVQSTFLSLDDAVRVAESIRPTETGP
jgi:hypothetical protein